MENVTEQTIPLEALKDVLNAYDKVYKCNVAALDTFDYKMKEAKYTLDSLLFTALAIFIIVAAYLGCVIFLHCVENLILSIIGWVLCLIVLGISLLFFIFTLVCYQSLPGKKPRLHFRIIYNIKWLSHDLKEIKKFRKKFNIKASALSLIRETKKAKEEAYDKLSDWAYGVNCDYVNLICDYKDRFSGYKDYTNLDSQWNICGELLDIINSGRAFNLKEALASFDLQKFKEEARREINNANLAASRARAEAASARADAAEAQRKADDAGRWYY